MVHAREHPLLSDIVELPGTITRVVLQSIARLFTIIAYHGTCFSVQWARGAPTGAACLLLTLFHTFLLTTSRTYMTSRGLLDF